MKKKLLAVTLALCMAAVAITASSLAYFTDTHTVDNVFAVGEVKIRLDETEITLDANGHAVEGVDRTTAANQTYGKLYPGQVVTKDPVITNIGSEDAYVAAKIVITANNDFSDSNKSYVEDLLSGGLLEAGSDAVIITGIENGDYVIYIMFNDVLEAAGNASVTLFDKLSVPASYNNEAMKQLADMHITVTAYAVQSIGFADAKTALTTAFETELAALQ